MAMPMRAGRNPKSSSSDMICLYGIRDASVRSVLAGAWSGRNKAPGVVLAKPAEGRK